MAKKKLKDMSDLEKTAHSEKQRLAAAAAAKKKNDLLQHYLKACINNKNNIIE